MKWLFPTTLALLCAATVFAEVPVNLSREDPDDGDVAEINIFPIGECDGPFSKSLTFPTDVVRLHFLNVLKVCTHVSG